MADDDEGYFRINGKGAQLVFANNNGKVQTPIDPKSGLPMLTVFHNVDDAAEKLEAAMCSCVARRICLRHKRRCSDGISDWVTQAWLLWSSSCSLFLGCMHSFLLMLSAHSSTCLWQLAVVANSYFQHTPAVRPNDTHFNLLSWSAVIATWQWSWFPTKHSLFALHGTLNLSPLLNVRTNLSLSSRCSMPAPRSNGCANWEVQHQKNWWEQLWGETTKVQSILFNW